MIEMTKDKATNHVLVKSLGGSRAYGLENPASDYDYRGVFLNGDLNYILGLDKYEYQELPGEEDTKYKELRHFLNLLKQANTECLEIMFTEPVDFLEVDPLFLELQKHKFELLDSERAFKTLRGYMAGERLLANGTRTGRLGGKRHDQVKLLGFSPKNFTQLFRLSWVGTIIFQEGLFPVNVKKHDVKFAEFLLSIKNTPENWTKEELNTLVDEYEERLNKSFDSRKFNYTFNQELANNFVLKAYYPLLTTIYCGGKSV